METTFINEAFSYLDHRPKKEEILNIFLNNTSLATILQRNGSQRCYEKARACEVLLF